MRTSSFDDEIEDEEECEDALPRKLSIRSEEVALVDEAWSLGHSAKRVSADFGLPLEDVESHFLFLVRHNKSHYDRLRDIVNDLDDQCTLTKKTLEVKQSALLLQSYQRMMSEYRIALAEMTALEKPQDVVDDIVKNTFNPFVVDLVRLCTEEASRLQQEMLKAGVPVRDAKGIATDSFSRLTDRIKALIPVAKLNLDMKLGVKKSDAEDRLTQSKEEVVM